VYYHHLYEMAIMGGALFRLMRCWYTVCFLYHLQHFFDGKEGKRKRAGVKACWVLVYTFNLMKRQVGSCFDCDLLVVMQWF
jgi:hypothetical protein